MQLPTRTFIRARALIAHEGQTKALLHETLEAGHRTTASGEQKAYVVLAHLPSEEGQGRNG